MEASASQPDLSWACSEPEGWTRALQVQSELSCGAVTLHTLTQCCPRAQAKRHSLPSRGELTAKCTSGCKVSPVSGTPLTSRPFLGGRMPVRCLRGSVAALWDPALVLYRAWSCMSWAAETTTASKADLCQMPTLWVLNSVQVKATLRLFLLSFSPLAGQKKTNTERHIKLTCTHFITAGMCSQVNTERGNEEQCIASLLKLPCLPS